MEVTYKTLITGLKKAPYLKDSDYTDVVTTIDCQLTITKVDDNTSFSSSFSANLDTSNLNSFINLVDLDEQTVLTWLETNEEFINQKQALYNRLEEVFYPTKEPVVGISWITDSNALNEINSLQEQIEILNLRLNTLKSQNGITD